MVVAVHAIYRTSAPHRIYLFYLIVLSTRKHIQCVCADCMCTAELSSSLESKMVRRLNRVARPVPACYGSCKDRLNSSFTIFYLLRVWPFYLFRWHYKHEPCTIDVMCVVRHTMVEHNNNNHSSSRKKRRS